MMKLMKTLGLAMLIVSSPLSFAAAPAAAPAAGVITVGHVQAVTDLMAAMQMEKMMRTITGSSRYASEAQRAAAYAKLEKVPPAQIYARLAYPLARTISAETASEMARFYSSSYGKKIVYGMYNSKASYGEQAGLAASAAERKDMQRPAFIKASKALAEADGAIRHEGFVLLQSIAK
jgi:sRNA-binding protein